MYDNYLLSLICGLSEFVDKVKLLTQIKKTPGI